MKRFNEFKKEILKRSKAANACTDEYRRAYKSEDFASLIEVIKNNFNFAVNYSVIDSELIDRFKEEFNSNQVYSNVDVSEGYLLAWGNATVRASDNVVVSALGNATVRASDNVVVSAWDNATVSAWDNVVVSAWDNVVVSAWDNVVVRASGNATVRASGNVVVSALGNATVRASDNVVVSALGNATVEAWGNAYISSFCIIECKLRDNAIYRIRSENKLIYASEEMRIEKVVEELKGRKI